MAMRKHFKSRHGQVLNYADCGTPAGTTLIWIHGLSMSLDYWEGIWQNFSDFRNVRIDVPGHGGSEPRVEGLELEQFGHDIIDLVQHLQLQRVVLLGHSLGGMIALSAALDLPELLGLVLMSTSSRVSSRAREGWRRSAQVARKQGQEAWAKIQEMVAESQIEKEMPKLGTLPALILQGDADQQTPVRAGEILRDQLPKGQLQVFRAGHNLLPESPEALRCCAQWLSSQGFAQPSASKL
ncbi:unnamed protein product [Cladocopium goreaui]|uniref:AB hydrolase-1 domain-containing protein n=1 Tax=Cladocopium goreaui TaxID=2562237 RepID=A0A9P1FRX3_9DINO|nr:unnamed protein product [Cladocopium goreaui]